MSAQLDPISGAGHLISKRGDSRRRMGDERLPLSPYVWNQQFKRDLIVIIIIKDCFRCHAVWNALTNLNNKKPRDCTHSRSRETKFLNAPAGILCSLLCCKNLRWDECELAFHYAATPFFRTPLAGKMNDNNKHEGTIKMQITFCPKEIRIGEPNHVRFSHRAKGLFSPAESQ